MKMKKCNKVLLTVFMISAIAVGAAAAIAVLKSKFQKKYITVCD
jgi:hypothetical protein